MYLVHAKLAYINQDQMNSEFHKMMEFVQDGINESVGRERHQFKKDLMPIFQNRHVMAHAIVDVANHELSKRKKRIPLCRQKMHRYSVTHDGKDLIQKSFPGHKIVQIDPADWKEWAKTVRAARPAKNRSRKGKMLAASLRCPVTAFNLIKDGEERNALNKIMQIANTVCMMFEKGLYQPSPYRLKLKRKKDGHYRPVRAPIFIDKVVQRIIAASLSLFSTSWYTTKSQYAYRIGVSAKDAVQEARVLIERGYTRVLCADVRNFFDEIDRSLLIGELRKIIADDNCSCPDSMPVFCLNYVTE